VGQSGENSACPTEGTYEQLFDRLDERLGPRGRTDDHGGGHVAELASSPSDGEGCASTEFARSPLDSSTEELS
jgi:hypothetical protein